MKQIKQLLTALMAAINQAKLPIETKADLYALLAAFTKDIEEISKKGEVAEPVIEPTISTSEPVHQTKKLHTPTNE